ncbi:MAG: YfcE family phosphodiesterase [Promethearchaeota archaeon]
MRRFLIIGDSHIPRRAKEIPPLIEKKIKELRDPILFSQVLFTGDLIKAPDFVNFLELSTKGRVIAVIGNMDYFDGNRDAPIFQDLKIKLKKSEFQIGLTHGAQIHPRGDHNQLELLAIEKKCNILISGHTHHEEIFLTDKGILLLNPGSVTGAWSFVASGTPSFMLLTINEEENDIIVSLFLFIYFFSNSIIKGLNKLRARLISRAYDMGL